MHCGDWFSVREPVGDRVLGLGGEARSWSAWVMPPPGLARCPVWGGGESAKQVVSRCAGAKVAQLVHSQQGLQAVCGRGQDASERAQRRRKVTVGGYWMGGSNTRLPRPLPAAPFRRPALPARRRGPRRATRVTRPTRHTGVDFRREPPCSVTVDEGEGASPAGFSTARAAASNVPRTGTSSALRSRRPLNSPDSPRRHCLDSRGYYTQVTTASLPSRDTRRTFSATSLVPFPVARRRPYPSEPLGFRGLTRLSSTFRKSPCRWFDSAPRHSSELAHPNPRTGECLRGFTVFRGWAEEEPRVNGFQSPSSLPRHFPELRRRCQTSDGSW